MQELIRNKIEELQGKINNLDVLNEDDRMFIIKYAAQKEILLELLTHA